MANSVSSSPTRMVAGQPFWYWGIPLIEHIVGSGEGRVLHLNSPVVQHWTGDLYARIIPSIPVKTREAGSTEEILVRMVVYKSLVVHNSSDTEHEWWCMPYDMFHSPDRFVVQPTLTHRHTVPTNGVLVKDADQEGRRFALVINTDLNEPMLIQLDR